MRLKRKIPYFLFLNSSYSFLPLIPDFPYKLQGKYLVSNLQYCKWPLGGSKKLKCRKVWGTKQILTLNVSLKKSLYGHNLIRGHLGVAQRRNMGKNCRLWRALTRHKERIFKYRHKKWFIWHILNRFNQTCSNMTRRHTSDMTKLRKSYILKM